MNERNNVKVLNIVHRQNVETIDSAVAQIHIIAGRPQIINEAPTNAIMAEKIPTVPVWEEVAALFFVVLVEVLVDAVPVALAPAVTVADATPDG